jgi:omega-6 fatty acid desaturase (delta-12 desaturase)
MVPGSPASVVEPKNTDFGAADLRQLRGELVPFERSSWRIAGQQLANTFIPILAVWTLAYLAYPVSLPLAIALSAIGGGLLVRVTIIQHDCMHGSFMPSRRVNHWIGHLCSIFNLIPFLVWRRQHATHHGVANNLDRRTVDLWSNCITREEYLEMTRWGRIAYRVQRHPFVLFFVLPVIAFGLLYRLPLQIPHRYKKERRNVWLLDAALVAILVAWVALLDWQAALAVHLSMLWFGSAFGTWLIFLQHQFIGAQWYPDACWSFRETALRGSSFLDLPAPLRWFSADFGYHHVHHMAPAIPSYRLARCHEAVSVFGTVPRIGLLDGLRSVRLALWDSSIADMIPFAQLSSSDDNSSRRSVGTRGPIETATKLSEGHRHATNQGA